MSKAKKKSKEEKKVAEAPPPPEVGRGVFLFEDGTKYVGEWKAAADGAKMKHGQGKYCMQHEEVYDGQWVEDEMHGQGTFSFASGAVYHGNWEHSMFHGEGTYTWGNGCRYTGQWQCNEMHGEGSFLNTNGDRWTGVFEHNRYKVGSGQWISPQVFMEMSKQQAEAAAAAKEDRVRAIRGVTDDVTLLIKREQCAPLLIRLAYTDASTYDEEKKLGGLDASLQHPDSVERKRADPGIAMAVELMKDIVTKYASALSTADIWSLAAVTAIRELGGPIVNWAPGRKDNLQPVRDDQSGVAELPNPEDGKGGNRTIFHRMGLSDREMVALMGAHCVGRAHAKWTGFEGPWTSNPDVFDNSYYSTLLDNKWVSAKSASGKKQFKDKKTGALMMLPSDMALLEDKELKAIVLQYAESQELFFKEFAGAFAKFISNRQAAQ